MRVPKNAAYLWQIYEGSSKHVRCKPGTVEATYFFITSDFNNNPVLAAVTLAARTGIVFLKASLSSVVFIQRCTGGDTSRVNVQAMILEKRDILGCFLEVRHDCRPSIVCACQLLSHLEFHHHVLWSWHLWHCFSSGHTSSPFRPETCRRCTCSSHRLWDSRKDNGQLAHHHLCYVHSSGRSGIGTRLGYCIPRQSRA